MNKKSAERERERVVNSSLAVFINKYMNRTLKLFGQFFVFALVITIFSFAVFTFSTNTASADCSITSTLRLGSSGVEVQCLQGKVGATADGSFGPLTLVSVKAYQASHGLVADGIVGSLTRAVLNGMVSMTFPAGCSSALGFSTNTGLPCTSISTLPVGCSSVSGFSTSTGMPCSSGSSLPASCTSSLGFSTTTGKSCATTPVIYTTGCTSGALFNTITGKSCTTITTTLPAGCTSSTLFSTTTGVSCTTGLSSTPIIRPSGGGGGGGGSSPLIQLTISNPTLTTSKEYDRTTTAVITVGSLSGVIEGDSVTVSAVANYDSVNIGTNKTMTVVYTLAGASAGKYIKPVDRVVYSGVITTKQLTILDPDLTLSKLYDTNTTAVVTAGALIGVAGTEDVTVTGVATYNNATVATDKTITVVYTLSGAETANYIKPVDYTTSQGVITALQLTIENPTSLITSKKYGGTTSTVVTAGALIGIISPDGVTVSAVANFDTPDVGTNKTITVVYTLAGTSSANYIAPINYTTTGEIIAAATVPSSITLAVGSTAPVGGVVNVAIPQPDATDTTGVVTGWVTTTADKIKFTVVDAGSATSTITINGGAYTSGANYQVVASSSGLTTIIVTTTEANVATVDRTFTISGPILGAGADNIHTYGVVIGADGKKWLDRNLGATQVATAFNNYQAYGSLFQWGRGADGHSLINHTSATAATAQNGSTPTFSATDTPGDNLFILAPLTPYDWRSTKNDNLWQGVNGTNNVCPTGYRLPTSAEWSTLAAAGTGITNSATAYSSSLKLTVAGFRYYSTAALSSLGSFGYYWSSSVSGTSAFYFFFSASTVSPASVSLRAYGLAVRCLKD